MSAARRRTRADVRNVQAARSDVRRDQNPQLAELEAPHRVAALVLRLLAVNAVRWRGRDALERVEKLLGALARVDENQDFSLHLESGDVLSQKADFLAVLRVEAAAKAHAEHLEALLDVGVRLARATDGDAHGGRH